MLNDSAGNEIKAQMLFGWHAEWGTGARNCRDVMPHSAPTSLTNPNTARCPLLPSTVSL